MGLNGVSHAYMVGLEDVTVVEANSIKPRPESEIWDSEWIKRIVGLPWKPKVPDEVDREGQPRNREEQELPIEPEVKPPDCRLTALKMTKKALGKFGYSDGCPGWRHAQGAPEPGEHTEEYRRRVEEAMEAEGGYYAQKLRDKRSRQAEAFIGDTIERRAEFPTMELPTQELPTGELPTRPARKSSTARAWGSTER